MRVLYLKPPLRRPICLTRPLFADDRQGAVPRAWCRECGREVFEPGRQLCPACEKEEREYVSKEKPL